MSQPATGKQLSPDNYFLIVDSYIISVCGNAVYALNALFCAHWAFKVDNFPRLQPFYNFLEVICLAKKTMCSILSLLSALVAKSDCLFWLYFLQLDYSLMFLMFHSNFMLSKPVTIRDQIVWAFANHCNNLSSLISPCTRKRHFRSARRTTLFKDRSTLCVKSWAY